MKRSRIWLILVALVVVLALSGCINIKEEMWFNADGSGKMTVDIGMSKALLDMAGSSGGSSSDPFADFKNQFENQKDPLVKSATPTTYTDKDVTHYAVTMEITDMLKYIEQQSSKSDGTMDMVLKKLENGNISFTQKLSSSGLSGGSGQDLGSSGMDASSLESVFKDMKWTMIIHATSVVSADKLAKVSGGTVQWEIPMSQVFAAKSPIVLNAEFSAKGGAAGAGLSPLVIVIIVVVVLLVAAAAVYFFVLRRKPTPAAASPFGAVPPQPGVPPAGQAQQGYPAQQAFPPPPQPPQQQGLPPQQPPQAPRPVYPAQQGYQAPPAAPTKVCPRCGSNVPVPVAFCPVCGNSFKAPPPAQNPPQ